MKKKIQIITTLGPSSLSKAFLKFSNKNIDLLRLNMSHIEPEELEKKIKFIRKFTKTNICVDTEGAQIRTKVFKPRNLKKNQNLKISRFKDRKFLSLYPQEIFEKLKTKDILNIGFNNLLIKINSRKKDLISAKVIRSGKLENNKGVHIENRKIGINFITEKDRKAILIAKKNNVKHFALSFTNSSEDVENFNAILGDNCQKIFKIETKRAVKNFNKIIKNADNFLIDRGDLSKDISVVEIPKIQRKLMKIKKNFKNKKIFVATNLLESMIENNYPTRGEANDIYSSLEMGANGLVLAAETAIGKYPTSCVKFIKEMILSFKKY
mgnify:FL=1|tara:strand:+ start:4991 stop:5962 length:972 start_codon:yes stop_codon:yes gene_type:complete